LAQAQPLVGLLCCALLCLPLCLGWWGFWHLGRRAIATRRYPPAGTKRLRRQETLTGASALRRGRALCALALVLTMLTGLLTVVFWGLLLSLQIPGS
jgi:hypothetical protein